MCCLCFERVEQDRLHVLPDGKKENACQKCAEHEEEMLKLKGKKI